MTEHEWLDSDDPAAMLQLMTGNGMGSVRWRQRMRIDRPSDRKLRLFACACARQVWHLLTDPRSRKAVEVAERFADGGATGDELDTARDAARDAWDIANAAWDAVWDTASTAARDTAWTAWTASAAAWAAASDAASDAASTTARDVASAAARDAAWDAVWDAASAAARDAASRRQASLLRDIVGDPFRSVTLPSGPTCITPQVLSLAQATYDERLEDGTLDPFRLMVLADALEEAGCDDDTLLSHLRGQEACRPHCRGCWAVDLILGRG